MKFQQQLNWNDRPVNGPVGPAEAVRKACELQTQRVMGRLVEVLVDKELFDEADVLKILNVAQNEWVAVAEDGE